MIAAPHRLARALLGALFLGISFAGLARSAAAGPDTSNRPMICEIIEHAAAANRLPVEYLTRLLWTESRFNTDATSPAGAEGVAQFMPRTAAERGLGDPRDPAQAIAHAARLLVDLDRRFGNLGLAAAAYNAGPARVAKFLQAAGGLPLETRRYVEAVTGRRVEEWVGLGNGPLAASRPGSCTVLIAALARHEHQSLPPERIFQAKLDRGLLSAIALLASLPQTRPRPASVPGSAEALCDSIRSLGAACAVHGR